MHTRVICTGPARVGGESALMTGKIALAPCTPHAPLRAANLQSPHRNPNLSQRVSEIDAYNQRDGCCMGQLVEKQLNM